MEPGEPVLFGDDEPELELWAGTPATIVCHNGEEDVVIRLQDGRVLTTERSCVHAAAPASTINPAPIEHRRRRPGQPSHRR
jgi:hypothetical protein